MKTIVYTRYTVECKDDNFMLTICQHYQHNGESCFDYVEFGFTNYGSMRDFIDTLEARGVEMAR